MTPAEKLAHQLYELSMNMWWAWNPSVIKLFRDIDPDGFRTSKHNPLRVIRRLSREHLTQLAGDAAMRARVDRAFREFRAYVSPTAPTWAETHAAPLRVRPVAYFSAEFGIHESLPIYSGGLGVLAGDHLKTASDLGLALVAVGLYYRESYFRQQIDRDGQQHAQYESAATELMCTTLKLGADGKPLVIDVPLGHERLLAQIWQVNVGRNQLFLLPTWTAIRTRIAAWQLACTSVTNAYASGRSCCSGSAVSAPCAHAGSTGAACT
jgi:starch phosphorylase